MRPIPPMLEEPPRGTRTLVRLLATKAALLPALCCVFFRDDPYEGTCRRCHRPVTATCVIWECDKLSQLFGEICPASYIDWTLPITPDEVIISCG